jgi:hypothetical protein
MPREIITLQVGQCGNQSKSLANQVVQFKKFEFWRHLLDQYWITPEKIFMRLIIATFEYIDDIPFFGG